MLFFEMKKKRRNRSQYTSIACFANISIELLETAFMINSLKTVGHFYDPFAILASQPASRLNYQKLGYSDQAVYSDQATAIQYFVFLETIKYYITRCELMRMFLSRIGKPIKCENCVYTDDAVS